MFLDRDYLAGDDKVKRAVKDLYEACTPGANDYTNQLTIKLRVLTLVMKTMGLSRDQVVDLIYTHTLIHPEVADELRKLAGGFEDLLAQDLVSNEKLVRLLKRLSSRNQNKVDRLLAIDGLASKTKRYEMKRYMTNLRWPMEHRPDAELALEHVQVVRRLYEEIDIPEEERVAPYVYEVMREVLKDVTGVVLPCEEKTLAVEAMEKCKGLYLSCMGREKVLELVKDLKLVEPEVAKKRRRLAVTDEMENE